MQKQWALEMHYPGDGKDSLITTDSFHNFSEVERKMKPNLWKWFLLSNRRPLR